MAQPTMDRAIAAIDEGDLEAAREACEAMRHEWGMLHDLMAEGMLGLITFIQDRLGDEGVAAAWEESMTRGWKRHVEAINQLPRRRVVELLAATWRAHSLSGTGEDPASFTVTEDEEKVTFHLAPCGSGARLVRRGLYESEGYGRTHRRTFVVVRARADAALLHPLLVHERVAAAEVGGLPAVPARPAAGLRPRSVPLVLVQGPGDDPRALRAALRARGGRRVSPRALVTGGARGIGACVAERLVGVGFEVDTLDVLDGATHQVDLASDAPLPDLGDVDVLVSCAAITTTIAPAHRMSDEQWRATSPST